MDDLWTRNRRLLAVRLKWPDGALEVATIQADMARITREKEAFSRIKYYPWQ